MTSSELGIDAVKPPRANVAKQVGYLVDHSHRLTAWQWLAILWIIVTAYNIYKPFHIDDTAHLEIARWISTHPLHPMSGTLNWSGVNEPIYKTNQPHLYFYLLAGWASLFGFSEMALHSFQALLALACIVLFYRLARRFCPGIAMWLTAMLILGPAFVVEQNLMVDVPLLAMWLLFFEALLLHRDSPAQTKRYVLAGCACAAALLIKYSSLALVPVLAASLLLERRGRQTWTLLIPIGALVLWSAFNWWDYGGIHVATRQTGDGSLLRSAKFAVTWVIVVGAITPIGLIAAMQLRPRMRRYERYVYGVVLAMLLVLSVSVATGLLRDQIADMALALVFAANGSLLAVCLLSALLPVARTVWRHSAALRQNSSIATLLLWIIGGTGFYILFAPFIAPRHVLLTMPALLLVFGIHYGPRLSGSAKGFALGLTVLISIGLCVADWHFASFYRSAASQVARTLPPTGTVWTSGHWGWQWYAQMNGMRQVDGIAIRFRPGDWLIVADDIDAQLNLVGLELKLERRVTQTDPLLSLFCTGRAARFYASPLQGPWSLSQGCVGHLSIYRVMA